MSDRSVRSDRGMAMVALLVAMNIMAIMLAVALPAWRTYAQREKEAEFFFRAQQWARGIRMFQQARGGLPPDLDVLVRERFVRKKYKDPLTGDDFQPVGMGSALPGQASPQQPARGGLGAPPSEFDKARQELEARLTRLQQETGGSRGTTGAGIIGVTSKSNLKLFRVYNGRDVASEIVVMDTQVGRAGGRGGRAGEVGPGDGRGGRDGRGAPVQPGRGLTQPGGRGTQPQPAQPGPARGQQGPGRGFTGRNFQN